MSGAARLVAAVLACSIAAVLTVDGQVFRSAVDSVELNVVVSSGNRSVGGLTLLDFAVSDNGVAQTVTSVTRETMPIDITLVIDSSASISANLAEAIVKAGGRIREHLRPDDRVSLMTFNQLIHERLALSPAASAGSVDLGRRVGGTALNDAIAVALTTPLAVDRRSMAIVFTDGYDTMSFLDERHVMEVAGRSRTVTFIVSKAGSFSAASSVFFDEVARATGGMVQMVDPFVIVTPKGTSSSSQVNMNPDLLDAAFLKAFEDFRTSYVLRYTLSGVPRPGWHDVSVKVTRPGKKYDVRTRKGYVGG